MSTRPEVDRPDIPSLGLYDLVFTESGFFRGGRFDGRKGRYDKCKWHNEDCLGRGEDCACTAEEIDRHYNDEADLEMNDE